MFMVSADVASLVVYLTRQFGFSFTPRRTQKFSPDFFQNEIETARDRYKRCR